MDEFISSLVVDDNWKNTLKTLIVNINNKNIQEPFPIEIYIFFICLSDYKIKHNITYNCISNNYMFNILITSDIYNIVKHSNNIELLFFVIDNNLLKYNKSIIYLAIYFDNLEIIKKIYENNRIFSNFDNIIFIFKTIEENKFNLFIYFVDNTNYLPIIIKKNNFYYLKDNESNGLQLRNKNINKDMISYLEEKRNEKMNKNINE